MTFIAEISKKVIFTFLLFINLVQPSKSDVFGNINRKNNNLEAKIGNLKTSNKKIDYLNTHGTSTPVGDITELKAIGEAFGENVPKISSTKSLSGHPLGAASVHEAIYSLIMMKNNFISASANISDMDDEAKKYPIVTKVEKDVNLNSVMSNSFGFGGTNATLVFEKVK